MLLNREIIFLSAMLLIATQVRAEDNTGPSLELLEFLADGTQVDSQWVDPLSLEEVDEEETP